MVFRIQSRVSTNPDLKHIRFELRNLPVQFSEVSTGRNRRESALKIGYPAGSVHLTNSRIDLRRERAHYKVLEDTVSLWICIENEHSESILNPLYDPLDDVIWPSVAPQSIQMWNAFYLR